MTISRSQAEAEVKRQALTGDTRYASRGQYVFILRIGDEVQQFPLILAPTKFEYTLPYAANLTPLQEGGVVSEEGGIVIGEISIEGTTGFKLRTGLADSSVRQGDPEFTGGVDPGGSLKLTATDASLVSGHMHFWRLANRCFDQYSSLKKNPVLAHTVSMELHVLKDDLHLAVVPRTFSVSRTAAASRVTYPYAIKLAVVGPAKALRIAPGPDAAVMGGFKAGIASLRAGIQSITAGVLDLTASMDEIRRGVLEVPAVIDDARRLVEASNAFITGQTKFFEIPQAALTASILLCDSVHTTISLTKAMVAGTSTYDPVWFAIMNTMGHIGDGMDQISAAVTTLGAWTGLLSHRTAAYDALVHVTRSGTDPSIDAQVGAKARTAGASNGRVSAQDGFGSALRAGDSIRSKIEHLDGSRVNPNKYSGFRDEVVSQGDTLQSLASKHLGNPNDWIVLAWINQLRPPFITASAQMPGTLQPGSRIAIPVGGGNVNPDTITAGQSQLGGSQTDVLLGVDFERFRLANGKFGWVVDAASGGTDVRKIRGIANLSQGIEGRLRTSKGHNILYPDAGMGRQIGNRIAGDDLVGAQFEARQQLLADKRVTSVSGLTLTAQDDALLLEANVVPLGYTTVRPILRQIT